MVLRKSDWHPADIIAALRKKGTTLAAVSREAGLSSSTLANALVRPWPKGEAIIAQKLGLQASEIWPSRFYHAETHQPLNRRQIKKEKNK